jgi:small subunit ribosomal protein S16
VAVKIKLKRLGKTHAPQYRIVVADSRTARNGRAIEEIGIYQPLQDPSIISVKSDRVLYWLGVGALPTPAVEAILKITGDWQKFKGLPGTEGTLRVAPPKVNKIAVFEAAVAEAANEPKIVKKPKLETPVEVVAEVVAEVAAAEVIAEEIAEEVATESAVTEVVSEDAPADVTPA